MRCANRALWSKKKRKVQENLDKLTDFFEWECQRQVEADEALALALEEKQRQRDLRRGIKPKKTAKLKTSTGSMASDTGPAGAARALLQ